MELEPTSKKESGSSVQTNAFDDSKNQANILRNNAVNFPLKNENPTNNNGPKDDNISEQNSMINGDKSANDGEYVDERSKVLRNPSTHGTRQYSTKKRRLEGSSDNEQSSFKKIKEPSSSEFTKENTIVKLDPAIAPSQGLRNSSQNTPETKATDAKEFGTTDNKDDLDYSDIIDPSFAELIKLEDIPSSVASLEHPSPRDIAELESSLQIGDKYNHGPDDGWRNDWSGNLQLYDREVVVNRGYIVSEPKIKPIKIPFYDWVAKSAPNSNSLRGLELLFCYVYHMKGTPPMAKKIMAYCLQRHAETADQRLQFILDGIRRISYDPVVLNQDGWTTKKSESAQGALGGAFLIGRRIIWQRYEALVIAFVRDEEFGCLWKAVWVEDLDTFDLEADELKDAMKKWDNKQAKLKRNQGSRSSGSSGSTRTFNKLFSVDGIENGIILAAPSNKASQGVMWPARVRHVVETSMTAAGTVRRNASKNLIQVVFLAPFWNGEVSSASKVAEVKDQYSLGPLFELDRIDATASNIQKYPFDSLSIEQLQSSFRFLGLPKAVFPRYLDSHRLAVALKSYAKTHIPKVYSHDDENASASASLTESHILSVKAPIYPQVVLNLPYDFILNKLPHPSEHATAASLSDGNSICEATINIDYIVRAMSPPECFGKSKNVDPVVSTALDTNTAILSPTREAKLSSETIDGLVNPNEEDTTWALGSFASNFLLDLFESNSNNNDLSSDGFAHIGQLILSLIAKLKQIASESDDGTKKRHSKTFLLQCIRVKGHGEETIGLCRAPIGIQKKTIVIEWRKTCERVYKRAIYVLSHKTVGNGITAVVTDSRCHGHVTANGAFERPVRIPAAIQGARLAGAGLKPNMLLITKVEDSYMSLAEDDIIPKAHKVSYIKRLKSKIAALPVDAKGVPLTDDSEGEGGDDTMGSRGSYTAATVGVAAALKATDMVVGGQCTNVFCATRPPGHHAGRELRPMKAISNGFCLLNAAACAAIFATTPQSEGGLGLKRVCVIDFDVHHGNGTQDILCSTYDPRYLYVSLHAGGAHINGFDDEDSEEEEFRKRLGGSTTEGIYPGRCGDSSPHDGVLNIPLGKKVTASDVGTALISQVSPRVEEFSPDLIILSAGFDAHKNDPLGMGGLSALDFGNVTEVACQMAFRSCSGRILSVLEGGYGVPCCRPRDDIFLPGNPDDQLLELGDDLPDGMDDPVPLTFRQKLSKCHAEGFLHCVKEHVTAFAKCSNRK